MTPPPETTSSFEFSTNIGELFTALAKLQERGLNVEMNSTGQIGQQKVAYANFTDVLKVFRPELARLGLALVQSPGPLREMGNARVIAIHSLLAHSSGQWIRSTMEIVCPDNRGPSAAQHIGSAITYGKRYAAIALLCMSTGEDDDDDGYAADTQENIQQRQGPQISHTDTAGPNKPWQELIEGRWQEFQVPGRDLIFADVERAELKSQLWPAALKAERQGDKPNPCVVASFFDAVMDIAASRREGTEFMEVLKEAAPGWDGKADPHKFSLREMQVAFNAIYALAPL